MEDLDVFSKLNAIDSPIAMSLYNENSEYAIKLVEHKAWLQNIRHERPSTTTQFRIGVRLSND